MKDSLLNRRFLNIFLLIFLVGFLFWPKIILAENEYPSLSKTESEIFLNIIQHQLFAKWQELYDTPSYFKPAEEAVVLTIRGGLQEKLFSEWVSRLSKGIIKAHLKAAQFLLFPEDFNLNTIIKELVEKLETKSVEEAKRIAAEWLFQNNVKTSSGELDISYKSYRGTDQKVTFQYVMEYHPLSGERGEVAVEFYSPKIIEPPPSTLAIPWDLGSWLAAGNETLGPFILRVKTGVKEMGVSYVHDPSIGTKVEVTFDEPVPELEPEEPLSFWEKIKQGFEKVVQYFQNTLSQFVFWKAQVAPSPVPIAKEIKEIEEEITVLEEKITEPEPPAEITLTELQEMLDDVAEQIDILAQRLAELIESQKQKTEDEEDEEIVEEEEEQETEEEGEQEALTLCELSDGSPAENKVIINEVAWMGTTESYNDEWLEFKNISDNEINLAGWQLLNKKNQIKIILKDDVMPAEGFYLLERTDDDSVPDITADFIYNGGLNNTDEALYLFDENCQLQDEVLASPDWPAGDNSSKRTMERKTDLTWQTSADPGGTPKAENSSGYSEVSGGGGWSPPPPSYPKILISEIQIAGLQDEKEEFVELYNPNETNINLTGWYLQRKTKTAKSYSTFVPNTLFSGKLIKKKDYLLVARQDSSFTALADILTTYPLTEDNTLVLKNPNREIVDKVGWGLAQDYETLAAENPPAGKSLGRIWDDQNQTYFDKDDNSKDFEIQTPTPKAKNQSPTSPVDTTPPARSDGQPTGTLVSGTTQTNISLETDEAATCKYSTSEGEAYDSMVNTFLTTGETSHSALVTDLTDGTSYNYYVKCADAFGNKNTDDFVITFSVASSSPAPLLKVVINEIAWMGTKASSYGEWIELYNNSDEEIDLAGWGLFKKGGDTLIINLTKKISPQNYYLIERTTTTSPDPISDIIADDFGQFGGGDLNNNGEFLILKDIYGNIIDSVDCSSGRWFAGEASPDYISMERINSNISGNDSTNWANNNLITKNGLSAEKDGIKYPINGTPKAENSVSKAFTEISGEVDFPKLTYLGSPYIIQWMLTISSGKTLTIEPGVVIKFKDGYSGIEVKGTLKAIGTDDKKIIFTSYKDEEYGGSGASPGDWKQIYFRPESNNSQFENVIVRYGGCIPSSFASCPWQMSAIMVDGTSITLKDSLIEKNKSKGVYLINSPVDTIIDTVQFSDNIPCQGDFGQYYGTGLLIEGGSPTLQNSIFRRNIFGIEIRNGASPEIKNNTFEENEKPIFVYDAYPIFSNNQATNNNLNGILVFGGNINQNATWQADLPYIIEETLTISQNVIFTLNPGVVIKFRDGSSGIIINGTLKAIGVENEKIIFTSYNSNPQAGDWRQIYFSPTSVDSELINVKVEYGGEWATAEGGCYSEMAAIRVKTSSIILRDSILENNKNRGLYLIDSPSTIDNVQFFNHQVGCRTWRTTYDAVALLVKGGSPTVENSTFKNNYYGIYIQSGEPVLVNLIFGIGDEANRCNIYQGGKCINPSP